MHLIAIASQIWLGVAYLAPKGQKGLAAALGILFGIASIAVKYHWGAR